MQLSTQGSDDCVKCTLTMQEEKQLMRQGSCHVAQMKKMLFEKASTFLSDSYVSSICPLISTDQGQSKFSQIRTEKIR